MKYFKRKWPTIIAIGFVLLIGILTTLNGCGSSEAKHDSRKLKIVTTTTMLADMAENLAGGIAEVDCLMGPGIDPHLYQASAGDVTKLQTADIVIYNGLHLEGRMGDIFASLGENDKYVICLEDSLTVDDLILSEDNSGSYDPHIWFDVQLWKKTAEYAAGELMRIDADHKSLYEANLSSYLDVLSDTDTYISNRVAELQENQRVLVTAHDAFRYFGRAYGIEVKGLQGISTDAEAGTADVSALAEEIANRRIKAIFIETSVPSKNIEALQAAVTARGFEVNIGGELFSDSLGDKNSAAGTYAAMQKANIDTIVDALK